MNLSDLQRCGRKVAICDTLQNRRLRNHHRKVTRKNSFRLGFRGPTPVEEQQQYTEHRTQQKQNQYLIQPPRPLDRHRASNSKPLLRSGIGSGQNQAIGNEEISEPTRMLVLLDNGHHRMIKFTLPEEACTVQEILEQANVPFTSDTPITVEKLNYIVTVGNVPGFNLNSTTLFQSEEYPLNGATSCVQRPATLETELLNCQKASEPVSSELTALSPKLSKESPPKLVQGHLSVCCNCGYLSEDFNKCLRCKSKLVKAAPNISSKKFRLKY